MGYNISVPRRREKHTPVNSSSDISGTSALSKSSLNIWKFTVHVLLKSGLENFEHFFASVCSVAQSCLTLCNPMNHSTPGLPVHQPTPRVYPNSCILSQWCHPTISSSVVPFSFCPQSFPASGSFPMSQLFTSGGQRIGVSALASVLPMNTQDWSPLGWTGWISLQSKGLSRVFWESQFLGRLIRSLGVPKERGVWNSQGGRKYKLFFSLHIP